MFNFLNIALVLLLDPAAVRVSALPQSLTRSHAPIPLLIKRQCIILISMLITPKNQLVFIKRGGGDAACCPALHNGTEGEEEAALPRNIPSDLAVWGRGECWERNLLDFADPPRTRAAPLIPDLGPFSI